jgi:Uma2 family endonuclease
VWLVSPESREVYIYATSGNRILGIGSTLTSELLPDFSLTLEELFRED